MATWTGAVNSNWSNAGNWQGGILPSATEGAAISAGDVTVDALGLQASSVSVFTIKTVTVGSGGGLTVGGVFEVFSGSSLVVRNGGSVSASTYNILGNLVIGGTGAATASGLVNGAINLSVSGAKLIFNTNDQSTFSNAISGSGSVEQNGTGANSFVTLSGTNTYTGTTTVNSSTLFALGGSAIADTGAVVVNAAGTFGVLNSETIGSLAGGGTVTLFNSSTLTTGGNNTSTTFSGAITGNNGTVNLTKIGTGTLTLSGTNTYNGATTVSAGTLRIENGSALGSAAGGTTVAANAALAVAGGITVGEALTLNGTGVSTGGALRNISGSNNLDGTITLGSETRINVDANLLTLSGGITGTNQNLLLGGVSGFLTISSAITTGTGSLTKDGIGSINLTGINTYTGTTTVNAGRLQISGGSAIADTGAVVLNGTSVFEVFTSETIGSLEGSGAVRLFNFRTLTTGGNNASTAYSGVISDSQGTNNLTKTGTGTLTLSGTNTYAGVTTISGGTLALSGSGSIAASGDLRLTAPGAIFDISAISGPSASIRNASFGAGSNGTINLGGKTLNITNASDLGVATVKGRDGATDVLNITQSNSSLDFSIRDVVFDTWTSGIDKVRITANASGNVITGSAKDDVIDGGAGADTVLYGGGSFKVLAGSTASDLTIATQFGIDRLINVENVRFGAAPALTTAALAAQAVPLTFANPITGIASFGTDLAAGGWTSDTRFHREMADVNGDGRADIIGFGGAATFVALAKSDGSGTFNNPISGINSFGFDLSAGGWSDNDSFPRTLGDVNGDGRADIIGFGGAATFVALARSDGSGTFNAPIIGINSFGRDLSAGGWTSDNIFHREMADVNGDGREDIVGFGGAATFVALAKADNSGTFNNPIVGIASFGFDLVAGGWTTNDRFPRTLADVNGDGKADIIGFGGAGVFVALAKADGSGTFNNPFLAINSFGFDLAAGGWTTDNQFHREVVDVNRDGRADIIGFGGAGTFMALAKADNSGTFSPAFLAIAGFGSDPAAGGWLNNDLFPRTVADVTGDGFADIVGFGGAGTFVSASNWFVL